MILSLNSFRDWSAASARSTLERELTAMVCADVWARSHCRSGITMCYRPKDATLAVIIPHTLIGFRKGEPNNGWTKAIGVMVVVQTATVSDAVASSLSWGVPGPVAARAMSRSKTVGAGTSRTVIQSYWTFMVVGRMPMRTSLKKDRTLPTSGVALENEGVKYCTPQSTLMCGEGVFPQVSSRGLSARVKVVIRLRRNLGDVPYASSSRVKMAGKACSPESSPPSAPSVSRVSGAAWVCCVESTGGGCRQGVASGAWMAGVGRRPADLP